MLTVGKTAQVPVPRALVCLGGYLSTCTDYSCSRTCSYLSQILYGCKSAYCDTSTCLSRNKRGASKPYRPPTQLTARALAHYLASQSNPHRGLCPHELKVSPSSLEVEGAIDLSIESGVGGDGHYAPRVESTRTQHAVARAIDNRHQAKKDMKSIGQNLYDSVSLIYSYSKSIPNPLLALDVLRASNDDTRPDERTGCANESAVTARTNGTAAIARQHSQQNLRAQSQAHAARDQPQVFSDGQQVHKVPYHRPTAPDQVHSTRNVSNTPLDDTIDISKMSITKTGRKSFTLGGSIMPPITKSEAAPALVPSSKKVAKSQDFRNAAIPSTSSLSCDTLDQLKDDIHGRQDQSSITNTAGNCHTSQQGQSAEAFVNRSLFYTLSDAETLLQSFRDSNDAFQRSPLPHLDSTRLAHSFRDWSQRNGALIFDSLSIALEALFTRPPVFDTQNIAEGKTTPSNSSISPTDKHEPTARPRYLNNYEAAHIVMICIHALTSSVPVGWSRSWAQLRSLRSWGVVIPSAPADTDNFVDPYVNIIDAFEYEPALRLADRLLRGIGVRTCFEHILVAMQKDATAAEPGSVILEDSLTAILVRHLEVVEHVALESKRKMKSVSTTNKEPGWTVTATLIEWLKTVTIKDWDGKVEINKWSSVGTAVMLLHELRKHTFSFANK